MTTSWGLAWKLCWIRLFALLNSAPGMDELSGGAAGRGSRGQPRRREPAVRTAVQEAVTSQVDDALKHTESSLPAAAGMGDPLSNALAGLAGNAVSEFMASQT
jgi:hypothetical protein